MPNLDECLHANLDPKVVERFERRISRLLRDMAKHELSLFCGSGGSIRYHDGQPRPLIVGNFSETNHDGGDGAIFPDEHGLERGE